jgi:hypothetical protein
MTFNFFSLSVLHEPSRIGKLSGLDQNSCCKYFTMCSGSVNTSYGSVRIRVNLDL